MRTVQEPSSPGVELVEHRVSRDFVLAMLFVTPGALGIFAAIFPLSDEAPTELVAAVGTTAILAGLILLIPRKPLPDLVVVLYPVGGMLALSLVIANSMTQLGTAITAMPYLWFCVFFGTYLSPRVARFLVLLLCASFGVALIISEVPTTASLWVVFSATMVATAETLLASNQALRAMARQDPLTGLINRRGLEEAVGPLLAIGERIGRPTTLVVIDLDDFKAVNDSQGHAAGDRILKELAAAWSREKRDADLLARYGGDEFVVIMPATDAAQASDLVGRWRSGHPVAWSFGAAEFVRGEDLLRTIERADRSLYRAKPGVRHTFVDSSER